MQKPLKWHKFILEDKLEALNCDWNNLQNIRAAYDRDLNSYRRLQYQIDEAEKEGRDRFDAEKYRLRRGK